MSDSDKSKVLRVHVRVERALPPTHPRIIRTIDALRQGLEGESQVLVNVGWRIYGEMKTEIIQDCRRLPEKIQREVCAADRRAHYHVRVEQWFERPFMAVRA